MRVNAVPEAIVEECGQQDHNDILVEGFSLFSTNESFGTEQKHTFYLEYTWCRYTRRFQIPCDGVPVIYLFRVKNSVAYMSKILSEFLYLLQYPFSDQQKNRTSIMEDGLQLHNHNENENDKDDVSTMNATLGRKYKKLDAAEETPKSNTNNLALSNLKDASKVRTYLYQYYQYY